jgi:broad specificity phosphatase PhoE
MQAFAEDQQRAGLTDVGREQAEMTAEYLRVLDVDAIYSSTLGRALETAVIIAKKFPNTKSPTCRVGCGFETVRGAEAPRARRTEPSDGPRAH